MKLAELIVETGDAISLVDIAGITADSRQVMPGFVFFAVTGNSGDGCSYALEAEKKGAIAVIAETGISIPDISVPVVHVDDIRHALAVAASRFYGYQPDIITAVTGTCGKTSVVSFLRQIWSNTGFSAASIGTIGVISPQLVKHSSLTTPDAVEMHSLLRKLAGEGVTHVAVEASSHGIDQKRLDGIKLAVAAFTNLGHDHRDYHTTIEDYFYAKMRLFDTLLPEGAPAIVYADSKYSSNAIQHIRSAKRNVLTVGYKGLFIRIRRIENERFCQYAELEYGGHIYDIMLPLEGEFQLPNVIVAAGIAIAVGGDPVAVFKTVEQLEGAPGRLDLVGVTCFGAAVYVDYAHKPDALENVLKSMRPFTTGRIILVFGCGGDRDKSKRPVMGEIAARFADVVIVTDDNPRTENPADIRKQILAGAPGAIETDCRRKAIYQAVAMLNAGDTLIIAGKGHEEGQIIGDRIFPFSDHIEVCTALEVCK